MDIKVMILSMGGLGDDSLEGYQGNDTYVWASGDGNDTINERNYAGSSDDVILLTGGIVATDVTFEQVSSNLEITHTPSGEVITIYKQYSSDSDYHVETLLFDNGSTVDLLGI